MKTDSFTFILVKMNTDMFYCVILGVVIRGAVIAACCNILRGASNILYTLFSEGTTKTHKLNIITFMNLTFIVAPVLVFS